MKTKIALFVFSALVLRAAEDGLPPPREGGFHSNCVRIRHVEGGHGPAVVLIHGYLADADRHWVNTGVFAKLAQDHRVIALDCRGHGKSDKPADPGAYGAEMARDVVRLLDHLKIVRAHIVGFSMGAFLVGHLLTTDANRFLPRWLPSPACGRGRPPTRAKPRHGRAIWKATHRSDC